MSDDAHDRMARVLNELGLLGRNYSNSELSDVVKHVTGGVQPLATPALRRIKRAAFVCFMVADEQLRERKG